MSEGTTISVSKLNEYLKHKLEGDFLLKNISVSGEISNLVFHASGHIYFTLKDEASSIRCVMFKGYREHLTFSPENGMHITATGEVSVYARGGNFELIAFHMKQSGAGALALAIEALKQKLYQEGLFDESLKKPLPPYPTRIGVVTSKTGAVIHDISNVLSRRFPLAEVKLYPANVQGSGAAKSMIDALLAMDEEGSCDVCILARGGGSVEDLFEFNDEALVRTVARLRTPIISAVGHEVDYTLVDFTADLRAPTPSAAAELVVPSASDVTRLISSYFDKIYHLMDEKLASNRLAVNLFESSINTAFSSLCEAKKTQLTLLSFSLKENISHYLYQKKLAFATTAETFYEKNPSLLLKRGYGIASSESTRITSISQLKKGEVFSLRLSDGTILSQVLQTKPLEDLE